MKTLLLLLALLPVTASAAQELDCKDVHAGPDHGYYATVKRLTSATVTMESFVGMQAIAQMKCTMPHGMNRPDRAHLVAVCFDKTSGKNWMLTIHADANGATSAELEINGGTEDRQPVAKLDCRAR